MDKKVRKDFLVSGIVLQLIGVFFFFTFWLMYVSIPFFIGGIILISLSRGIWYIKFLTVSPILYVVFVITNAVFFERYILPPNFKGVVYVITDKSYGAAREYDFFTRIYRIPKSGVLFTKFNLKVGFIKRSFFQDIGNGKIKALGELDYRDYIEKWVVNPPKTEPSRDSFAVFTPDLVYNFDSKKYDLIFTVGTYKDTKVWNYLPPETIDSLRKILANKHK